MKASVEISLYPLEENYKNRIIEFVGRLKSTGKFDVITNGMSTQLFGDYEDIMDVLKSEIGKELSMHRTMAILKIGDGLLRPEDIPEELK
jgi:uncharacterized protein YqgV (UPF0045/DUF77 family)